MIDTPGIGYTFTASYPSVSSVTSAAFNIAGVSTGYLYDAELTYLQPGQPQTGAAVLGSPTDRHGDRCNYLARAPQFQGPLPTQLAL